MLRLLFARAFAFCSSVVAGVVWAFSVGFLVLGAALAFGLLVFLLEPVCTTRVFWPCYKNKSSVTIPFDWLSLLKPSQHPLRALSCLRVSFD